MEKFTASNGVEITLTNDGDETYLLGKGEVMPSGEGRLTVATGGPEGIAALREFFLHERDQELGRWRWPENPDVVVQVDESGERAWIVDERKPRITGPVWRVDVDCSTAHAQVVAAARAYFAAHPEPKPWHDAKPGEVWACVQSDHPGEEHAYWVNDNGSFIDVSDGGGLYGDDRECIESARRIWPEENSCSTP